MKFKGYEEVYLGPSVVLLLNIINYSKSRSFVKSDCNDILIAVNAFQLLEGFNMVKLIECLDHYSV